jgi:hypothetical protein
MQLMDSLNWRIENDIDSVLSVSTFFNIKSILFQKRINWTTVSVNDFEPVLQCVQNIKKYLKLDRSNNISVCIFLMLVLQ